MKKYNHIKLLLAGLVLIASSCKTEIDAPAASKGTADFTKYIAIGNSLTAGYADKGLYLAGQLNAYPNIISMQMKAAGGGDFKQPLFTEAQSNGSGYLKLGSFNADGTPNLVPVSDKTAYRDQAQHLTKYTDEIQNLGIPGMRLDFAFVPEVSAAINFFERLLPAAEVGNKTYFAYVQGRNHTFFSSWIGNNDVLGWATNGGVTEDATNVLTNKQTFAGAYSTLVNALTAQGQKGVLATIPDVTAVPYFTTVTVDALLAGAKKVNPNAAAIYIQTNSGPRAATSEDLITLVFNSTGLFGKLNGQGIPYGLHPANPIASKYVLDKAEIATARDYINSYNTTIKGLATAKNLAVFDAFAFLNTLPVKHMGDNGQAAYTGIYIDGVNISSAFITGNAFSLDGVHLTQKGYAIVANEFIKAINAKYGSSLNTVSLSNYPAVIFP